MENILKSLQPLPQEAQLLEGAALVLTPGSRFWVTAPEAEKGPVLTAAQELKAFLQHHCGEDCFSPDGIPVVLELGDAPQQVKNEKEAYKLTVTEKGITVTGFGASGLFYGTVTLKQLMRWDSRGCSVPALEILDWPDCAFRAYKQECRYGSNMMEKQDWFDMIDDLASKKINHLTVAIYGCWELQYDGRLAEYLYLPIKNYPQLKTPMTVRYYSPTEKKWFDYEQLPPMFRDNFLGEVIRYAKDHGMDAIPGINSMGHNTLFPRLVPEAAPINDEGVKQPTGFCTSSEETYKLLFSVYDQIIDEYLIPNDLDSFAIHLDEVWEQYGINTEEPYSLTTPWCRCEKCRDKSRAEIFIEHAIRCIKHLKEKGIRTVMVAHDMIAAKRSKLGDISEDFQRRIKEEGLEDVMLFSWWWYHDVIEKLDFTRVPDDIGLRSAFCAWNGYYIWEILTNPLKNCQIMANMNQENKCGEGMYQYAMYDLSYDRVHDCFSDYAWNFEATGDTEAVTDRYVRRHFGPMEEKVRHAYRLMDWITEERKENRTPEDPTQKILCSFFTLRKLSYYSHCYFNKDQVYPRHFPGSVFDMYLPHRKEVERIIYATASMGKEAMEIFEEAARTPGCNQEMARRMAYECHNYVVLAQDWIAFFQMLDMKDNKAIAQLARKRQAARLALMEHCEQAKEAWVCKAATMRNHSIFMQTFADIATYLENDPNAKLNLMDIREITSPQLWRLR
ncbi:MAG: family 20 glycosylhydrolase [Oscillospiraceae bacterium]|nr:family 20 glycosylhydrolase [Oscillospiraceae bacterium]